MSLLLYNLIFLFQVSSSSFEVIPPPAVCISESERCPICICSLTTQEVGTPESCNHSFCVDCLQEWSRVGNYSYI
jgi:hypothetical protein